MAIRIQRTNTMWQAMAAEGMYVPRGVGQGRHVLQRGEEPLGRARVNQNHHNWGLKVWGKGNV